MIKTFKLNINQCCSIVVGSIAEHKFDGKLVFASIDIDDNGDICGVEYGIRVEDEDAKGQTSTTA